MKELLLFLSIIFIIKGAHSQSVATGEFHSIIICNNNVPQSFGRNQSGELGDGTNLQKNYPVQIDTLTGIIAVDAGSEHSLFGPLIGGRGIARGAMVEHP